LKDIEISFFGPGIGECIVSHLGNNQWMIVDSCLDPSTRAPIALQYLNQKGVNVATDVKLFLISHWHDDHISGASEVLRACKSAKFVCSAALRCNEFVTLVSRYQSRSMMISSGVDEFAKIIGELESRSKSKKVIIGPDTWALADKRIFFLPNHGIEVFTLSPSDAALTHSFSSFAKLIPTLKSTKNRVIDLYPNHAAVCVWINLGKDLKILLGADLEVHREDSFGWKAIFTSNTRPAGKVLVIKVPHHGSSNSYLKEIWTELIDPDPIAVITPFTKGEKPLPTDLDLKNIRQHSKRTYCTGSRTGGKHIKRDSSVEKTLKEFAKSHRVVTGKMGRVTVTFPDSANITGVQVSIQDPAHRL